MSDQHDATILVVDDNPVNLRLLFEYLGTEGFRVLVCEDGESAVEQARVTLPDLVLMDVLLPGMSGYDSCRAIHSHPDTAHVPVIFLTALSRTSDKIEGFTAGGVDYLTKPLQFEEVLARVATHLSLGRFRKQLEQKNRELERRDRRREQLFGIIAHDLRSPINACVSGLRLLRSESEDVETRAEILSTLEQRAVQLDAQISDLLKWGELQIDDGVSRPTRFDLALLLDSVLVQLSEQSKAKNLSVSIDVPRPGLVEQDEIAVRTIVTNLLANAVKFTPAGGSVTVKGVLDSRSATVEVTDTGIGMGEEQLSQLFRQGARLHRPGTEGEAGSGLGLLLSSEIAEMIGGEITATSSPDTGSTFLFSFAHGPGIVRD